MASTLLRPLSSVGTFVFDCELSSSTGQTREYSTRRLPTGEVLSDHSVLDPAGRSFNLTGRVSRIPQPQNFGRPQPRGVESRLEDLVGGLARSAVGQSTRIEDAQDVLEGIIGIGEEVTITSAKLGRFTAVVTGWQVASGPSDGGGSTYSVDLWQASRASDLSFVNPNEEGAALNGSGATTDLGPTSTTEVTLDLVA